MVVVIVVMVVIIAMMIVMMVMVMIIILRHYYRALNAGGIRPCAVTIRFEKFNRVRYWAQELGE
jgi:hypothetical protein